MALEQKGTLCSTLAADLRNQCDRSGDGRGSCPCLNKGVICQPGEGCNCGSQKAPCKNSRASGFGSSVPLSDEEFEEIDLFAPDSSDDEGNDEDDEEFLCEGLVRAQSSMSGRKTYRSTRGRRVRRSSTPRRSSSAPSSRTSSFRRPSRRQSSRRSGPSTSFVRPDLEDERDDIDELVASCDAELRGAIQAMSREELEAFAFRIGKRIPEALDLIDKEDKGSDSSGDEGAMNCICGLCVPMPTEKENKCCRKSPCITTRAAFRMHCVEASILRQSMRIRNEVVLEGGAEPTNRNFRFAGYRNFTLYQYGLLNKGLRLVIPSCTVTKIRSLYPAPDGVYVGFIPGRLPD